MASRLKGSDPFGANVRLDKAVMRALPEGSRIISTTHGGPSLWVATMNIRAKLPDGTVKMFFKKGATGDVGLNMMRGAYESEKALHSFVPEHVPEPVAYGSYVSQPDTHFYLSEFVAMSKPDRPEMWGAAVSKLHRRSMGKSPGPAGRPFGFHINAHLANIPLDSRWHGSWEGFWTQQVENMFAQEAERRPGQDDPDWERLKRVYLDVVVPRYIRPLEADGRRVTPCLLHNDLWPGNTGVKVEAPDTLCIFDSAVYWGHNECDLRVTFGRGMAKEVDAYCNLMGKSEPRDEFFLRQQTYAVLGMTLRSGMYNTDPARREMTKEHIKQLADKVILGGALRPLSLNSVLANRHVADLDKAHSEPDGQENQEPGSSALALPPDESHGSEPGSELGVRRGKSRLMAEVVSLDDASKKRATSEGGSKTERSTDASEADYSIEKGDLGDIDKLLKDLTLRNIEEQGATPRPPRTLEDDEVWKELQNSRLESTVVG